MGPGGDHRGGRGAPPSRAPVLPAGVAFAGFGLLWALVAAGRTGAVDLALARALQRLDAPWLARAMAAASWPGYPPQSRVLPPLIVLALWRRGWRLEAGVQLLAWGTGLLATLAKAGAGRPRPADLGLRAAPAPLRGSSFPAGHVLTYLGVYGMLAYLLRARGGRAAGARLAAGLLWAPVALVGPSRVHQGHHWPSDVLAAYLLGGGYLLLLARLYRRLAGERGRACAASGCHTLGGIACSSRSTTRRR